MKYSRSQVPVDKFLLATMLTREVATANREVEDSIRNLKYRREDVRETHTSIVRREKLLTDAEEAHKKAVAKQTELKKLLAKVKAR